MQTTANSPTDAIPSLEASLAEIARLTSRLSSLDDRGKELERKASVGRKGNDLDAYLSDKQALDALPAERDATQSDLEEAEELLRTQIEELAGLVDEMCQERRRAKLKEVSKVLLPYCQSASQAESLANETFAVQSLWRLPGQILHQDQPGSIARSIIAFMREEQPQAE